MGIFDIFKTKKQEPEKQKINLDGIASFIDSEKQKTDAQEENFLKIINSRILQLIKDLSENTEVLRKINLDNKKVEDKVKLVVKENLNYYIHHLELLIESLKQLDQKQSSLLIARINKILFDFEKRSNMNFQKATFLIGKELEAVKKTIDFFFKDLKQIISENKELLEKQKTLSSITSNLNEIEENNAIKAGILDNIEHMEKKLSDLDSLKKDNEKLLEKTRKSSEYREEIKKEKEIEDKKDELKKQIFRLKESVDFKQLTSIFHSNEKKMRQIKDYQDNFLESLENNKLIELLKEAELDFSFLQDKMPGILELKKQAEITIHKTQENKIRDLENEITRINSDFVILKEEKQREIKKQERIEEAKNNLINSLRNELIKMNIDLI